MCLSNQYGSANQKTEIKQNQYRIHGKWNVNVLKKITKGHCLRIDFGVVVLLIFSQDSPG